MKKGSIYQIGHPAEKAYKPFINFVMKYADSGDKILDLGGGEGTYSTKLKKNGFDVICVDINEDYVKTSRERGVESYVMDGANLDFQDNSFDIILLIEVLEHVKNFDDILKEAKRVAKKYILITAPNCGGIENLKKYRLTYDHLLASDHVNFFTKKDLENVLSKDFEKFEVEEVEPIMEMVGLPTWLQYISMGLLKSKLIKANDIYYRLYAVIEV